MTVPQEQKAHSLRQVSKSALVLVLAGVCAVIAGALFLVGSLNKDQVVEDVTQQKDAAVQQKDQAISAAGDLCKRAQLDAESTAACAELERLRNTKPVPAEQVDYARVESFVNKAVSSDPRLSESSLLRMVQETYRKNPPKAGKTPSSQELLVLIRQVYAENPPKAGENGTNGKNAFCFDNPEDPSCQPKQGPTGENGTDGVDGAPGEPPFGWTTNYPDGSRQECRRASDFNPQQPYYECDYILPPSTEEPPPTTTTDSGLPLGGN